MTDTYDLLRQSEQFRQRVATMEMQATGVLGAAYADVLTQLEGRLDALERRIAERQAAGEPFSPSWLFQQDRYREMIRQTRQLMTQYGQTTATVTTAAQQAAVRAALVDAGRQVAAVAGGSGETSQMVAGWAAVPDRTVQSMVGALQESTPLGELLSEFGPDAVADVNRALVRGVGLGLGASDMTRAVVAALGISRARAESIVRTESMRAARTATLAAYKESGVVQGWRWSASLSARTCSACLSRHGNVYPLDVPMQSHQQCRCSASPWLGNDRDVPWESGEEWLARQSKSVQETVLGKEGASLFSGGQLRLSDYERVTPNARWGESVTSGGTAWAKRQAAKAGRPVAGSGRQPQWKPAMSRDEADRWAANSVLQAPLYHGTSSAASARSISENGFDLSIRTNGRAYGDGVLDWVRDGRGHVCEALEIRRDYVATACQCPECSHYPR